MKRKQMTLASARERVLSLLESNACPHDTMQGVLNRTIVQSLRALLESTQLKPPVVVEVNGGVVSNVWNCEDWIVLDWDLLLGDSADTKEEWSRLSDQAKEIVKREYHEDYDKIMKRINQEDRR